MDVLMFGASKQPLFGAYHPAEGGADVRRGIVLCYPFGQEYMRAHRAFRLLAGMLARKGCHTFRFDYRGTGDSAGNLEEFSAADWLDDIAAAVEELRDLTGLPRVGLIGLRLGALLAAHVASRRDDVESLVLWDPLVSGEAYLAELGAELARPGAPRSNYVAPNEDLHFNGFCLNRAFQASLRALDLTRSPLPPATRVVQVVSHESGDFNRVRAALCDGERDQYTMVAAPHDWNYVDHVGGILLPHPMLAAIADSL